MNRCDAATGGCVPAGIDGVRDGDRGDGLAGVESERLVLIGIVETQSDVDRLARTHADRGVIERIVDDLGGRRAIVR